MPQSSQNSMAAEQVAIAKSCNGGNFDQVLGKKKEFYEGDWTLAQISEEAEKSSLLEMLRTE